MADDLKIKVTIQGDDNLSGPAKSASKSLDKLNQSVDQTAKSSGEAHSAVNVLAHGLAGPVVAGVTAVAGGLAYASSKAAEFEKTISGVKAVTGATDLEMQQLSDLALELGATTAFNATEAAEAIGELAKGGVSVADIMGGAAKATLDLAAASGEKAAPAAALAANAMSLFNIEGEHTAEVANAVAGFANATTGDMNDFKFALSAVGVAAKISGQEFDQTAVALALMGKAGNLGSDAGTSLKTMLLNLIPTTKDAIAKSNELGLTTFNAAKAMDILSHFGVDATQMSEDELIPALAKAHLGITDLSKATDKQMKAFNSMLDSTGIMSSAFVDAEGNFKDLRDIAEILHGSIEGLSESQVNVALKTIFGNDAIKAAGILAEAGAEGFDKMNTAVTGTVTAEEVAKVATDNLTGSQDAMNGAMETAAITLGLELNKAIREVTDALGPFLTKHIIPLVKEYAPALGKQLVDTVHFLGQLADALGPLIGPVGAAFRAMVDDWGGALDATIGHIYDTIVAIVNLKNTIGEFFDAVGTRVRDVLTGLRTLFTNLGPMLKTAAEGLGKNIADGIAAGINPQVVITKLQSLAGDALQAAKDKIEAHSPAEAYAREVGLPIALGIVAGVERGTPAVIESIEEMTQRGLAGASALVRAFGLQGGGGMGGPIGPGIGGIPGFIRAWATAPEVPTHPGMSALEQSLYAPLVNRQGSAPRGALEQSLYNPGGAFRGGSPWLNVTPNQAAIGARQGISESLSQTELKKKFGEVGATAWRAFIEATQSGSLASGVTAGQAMQSVVDAIKAAGVPQWQELGATLLEAFTTSLVESTELSRARVAELLGMAQLAVQATQQIKTAARPDQSYGAGTGGGGTGGSGAGGAHTPFDVKALAAAMAQTPIYIQLDGQLVGQAVKTSQQRANEQTLTYPSGISLTQNGVGGVGGGGY